MSLSLPDDNKYQWNSYEIPPWPFDGEATLGDSNLVIRHLKQGRTGAVKTWPAAELLLDYLVRRGGLSAGTTNIDDDTLDLTLPLTEANQATCSQKQRYNIVELGGGSGYLSIALALSLNRQASLQKCGRFQPRVRIICTDHDGPTIKNMRHNVARQPRESNVPKAMCVETMGWDDDVGGDKFSKAVGRQFSNLTAQPTQNTKEKDEKDPIGLLTHLIGSDVHWGEATLDPLSSVISGFKLRNPDLRVILLLQERTPGAVAVLRGEIERKVKCGLQALGTSHQGSLTDFAINMRNVVHDSANLAPMKMVEC